MGGSAKRRRSRRQGSASLVDWPVANRLMRVVKTVRVQQIKRVKIKRPGEPRDKQKEQVALESTNFYASNVELGSISPKFIHQLGRSRWTIDATAFQTLTTDSHLKQPSVHKDVALVVLTTIRVLAYTLTRRSRNQRGQKIEKVGTSRKVPPKARGY